VALGAHFNVLRVYNLEGELTKVAADDKFGRTLQDLELL